MSPHLLFCRDAFRCDVANNQVTKLEGWCVGTTPVQALLLNGGGEFERLAHGFPRPDVHRAFPLYPSSEKSGFRLFHEIKCTDSGRCFLYVLVSGEQGRQEWHKVEAKLDTADIQTLSLDAATITAAQGDIDLLRAWWSPQKAEARFRRSLGAKRGLTLRLDIINKCNLRCVMCHFSDDAIFKRPTRQLTGDQFKTLFGDIGASINRVVLSCGDEPLTSKFLPEILRFLSASHPDVAIEFCTNAMLMRAEIRDLIMETRVERLLFSMDAVSKPLLEEIRVGCRYEQLVGNILALRDLKNHYGTEFPEFVFNFVMMNRNIHEAPAFVGLAQVLGAKYIDFRHMVPIETWFPPGEILADYPAKYNYYREKIVRDATKLGMDYYLPAPYATNERWVPETEPEVSLRDFRSVVPDPPSPGASQIQMRSAGRWTDLAGSVADEFSTTFCNRPFSEIMVRDQNEVLPCPWHGKVLGNLSDGKSLSEIFLGENFAALRRNMLSPEGDPNCARCPIKTLHLPAESGI